MPAEEAGKQREEDKCKKLLLCSFIEQRQDFETASEFTKTSSHKPDSKHASHIPATIVTKSNRILRLKSTGALKTAKRNRFVHF